MWAKPHQNVSTDQKIKFYSSCHVISKFCAGMDFILSCQVQQHVELEIYLISCFEAVLCHITFQRGFWVSKYICRKISLTNLIFIHGYQQHCTKSSETILHTLSKYTVPLDQLHRFTLFNITPLLTTSCQMRSVISLTVCPCVHHQ